MGGLPAGGRRCCSLSGDTPFAPRRRAVTRGKGVLGCEPQGQLYIPLSVADADPQNASCCHFCGNFPDRASQGQTSRDTGKAADTGLPELGSKWPQAGPGFAPGEPLQQPGEQCLEPAFQCTWKRLSAAPQGAPLIQTGKTPQSCVSLHFPIFPLVHFFLSLACSKSSSVPPC